MILALGEEVGPALRQSYKCPAIVKFQPAQANRAIEARRVFRRRRFVAEQERAIEFLNVDAAFLDRFEGLRVLHQAAGGFLWIAIRAIGGDLIRFGLYFSESFFSPRIAARYARSVA